MSNLTCYRCPLCTEVTCKQNGNPDGVDCHLCAKRKTDAEPKRIKRPWWKI